MLIGNEFWGYEYNEYVDAFRNIYHDVNIASYIMRGKHYDEGEWYIVYSESEKVNWDYPENVSKDYPMVAGARMAFFLGKELERD